MHWLGLATFQSISPASFTPDFVVSGFPEYKTTIESLDAAQRLELQRAALAIVNNMSSAAPVRESSPSAMPTWRCARHSPNAPASNAR